MNYGKCSLTGIVIRILVSFNVPASAIILFENPFVDGAPNTAWCDPCSPSQPSTGGVTGFRVWDSFTLTGPSTLESL